MKTTLLLGIMSALVVTVFGFVVSRCLDIKGETRARAVEGDSDLFESVTFGLDHVCDQSAILPCESKGDSHRQQRKNWMMTRGIYTA